MGLLDSFRGDDKQKDQTKNRPATPAAAPAPGAETARADFSNVRGASETTAPADHTATAKRTYTVKSGDSLSKIAQSQLGDGARWKAIYEANRDQISDPDLIHPGQVLNLPSA